MYWPATVNTKLIVIFKHCGQVLGLALNFKIYFISKKDVIIKLQRIKFISRQKKALSASGKKATMQM